MRKVILATNEIYHIFNRGVEKRPTFTDKREYQRAKMTLDFYRFDHPSMGLAKALKLEIEKRQEFFAKLKKDGKELVKLICYCLMPNHFHILLKQQLDGGITQYLKNFTNSYTRYFNTKHKRVGPLFQGVFKAVRIEDEDQLMHVSRYIHLNPTTEYLIKREELESYSWSSLPEYLGLQGEEICDKDLVLSQFSSTKKYRDFVYNQIDYAQKLNVIRHLVFQ